MAPTDTSEENAEDGDEKAQQPSSNLKRFGIGGPSVGPMGMPTGVNMANLRGG